jgi:hypothetical protein
MVRIKYLIEKKDYKNRKRKVKLDSISGLIKANAYL